MVTKVVDIKRCVRMKYVTAPAGIRLGTDTQSHIFPVSLGSFKLRAPAHKVRSIKYRIPTIAHTALKSERTVTAWAILDRLGYTSILEEVQGANLHRLENVMTLDVRLRRCLDELMLWFEAIGLYHCLVRITEDVWPENVPQCVQFVTQQPDLPLLSPSYLCRP
jgi:hypothetical protein